MLIMLADRASFYDEEAFQKKDFLKFIASLDLSDNRFLTVCANSRTAKSTSTDEHSSNILENLSNLWRLRRLTLNNCSLKAIPSSVGKLEYLSELNVSRNEIRSLKDKLQDCRCIRWIVARTNRITSEGVCGASLCKLHDLAVMDLSRNDLLFIPQDFSLLQNLTVLNLSNNKIRMIPKSLFSSLTSLLFLDISNNCLETVPETLQCLKKLKTLSLRNNNTLSGERLGSLVYLRSLRYLNVSNTDRWIGGIPNLRHLTDLKILDISSNSLPSFPPHLYELDRLRFLNAADNRMEFLPDLGRDTWQNLETLNLSRNRLAHLPTSLFDLIRSCRRLYLDCNKLTFKGLPRRFDMMAHLSYLTLSSNELEALPKSIGRCANLLVLNISNNKLASLPEWVTSLQQGKCIVINETNYYVDWRVNWKRHQNKPINTSLSPDNHTIVYNTEDQSTPQIPEQPANIQNNMSGNVPSSNMLPPLVRHSSTDEEVRCWYIDNFSLRAIQIPLVLYSGECYVFLALKDVGRENGAVDVMPLRYDLHIWIGSHSPTDKKGSVAIHAIQIARELERGMLEEGYNNKNRLNCCQTRQHDQGSEGDEFWAMLGCKLPVQCGYLSKSAFYSAQSYSQVCVCMEPCTRAVCRQMYSVNFVDSANTRKGMWAIQVPLDRQFMHKQSCLLIRIKNRKNGLSTVVLWTGRSVSTANRAKARLFAEQYCKQELGRMCQSIFDVQESCEPERLRIALFGKNCDELRFVESCGSLWRRLSSMGLKDVPIYVVTVKKCEIYVQRSYERSKQDRICLDGRFVYVIDCFNIVYVWSGANASQLDRAAGLRIAEELRLMFPRYYKVSLVSVQHEGTEDFIFKCMFEPRKLVGQNMDHVTNSCKISMLNKAGNGVSLSNGIILSETEFVPQDVVATDIPFRDNGCNEQSERCLGNARNHWVSPICTIEAIEMGRQSKPEGPDSLSTTTWSRKKVDISKLYSDMCYIFVIKQKHVDHSLRLNIDYNPENDDAVNQHFHVYFWQGRNVNTNKSWFIFNSQFRSLLTQQLGSFNCQRIYQQREPLKFLQCFDRDIAVFLGRGMVSNRAVKDCQLLQMSTHKRDAATMPRAAKIAYEIEKVEELCPMCVYIVYARLSDSGAGVVYIWQSQSVAEADVERAEQIAYSIYPGQGIVVQRIWQNHEPYDFFWHCLGGKKPILTCELQRLKTDLFICSNSSGCFTVQRCIDDICQDILAEGDVGILDSGKRRVFIWIGHCACESLILKATRVAYVYHSRCIASRSDTVDERHDCNNESKFCFVRQHHEPPEFRRCFPIWFSR